MTVRPNGRPSVAVVTASLSSRAGGLAATMPASVNATMRHGADISVFGLQDADITKAESAYEEGVAQAVPSLPIPGFRVAPALDQALAASNADALHLQGLWLYPSIATLRWARRTGRPVMISPHGMLDAWALRNSRWKKRLALMLFEHRNLSTAACIHALAPAELDAVRAFGLAAPVALIPNGVEMPELSASQSPPDCLENDNRRILLFLGRIHPKKGLVETIRAWAEVGRDTPSLAAQWVLVIAGWDDGNHLSELKRLAHDLSQQDNIRFVGPQFGADKEALLASAEAFILASHSEGLPMAVLEAWAHGCPVFMTRACNLPQGFAAGAGIEIPTDPSGMAALLANHLPRPQLAGMGAAGRKLAEAEFSWDRVGRDLASVYNWLAGCGPRPGCVVDP